MRKVLVTNDDGINAAGIKALVSELTKIADVYVFAPAEEQSGKSQGITFLRPVKTEAREFPGAEKAYAVDGTPTDCVKIGLAAMRKEEMSPDLVISGINLGYNTGLAAYYSGTIAAAREGALHKIRSIALSAGAHDAGEFGYLLGMLPMLIEMTEKTDADVFLNVNVPNAAESEIKGYKIVEAAPYGYGLDFVFEEQEDGLYQMTGAPAGMGESIKYDIDANEAGYASISPIPTSLWDDVSLARLQDVYATDRTLAVIIDAQDGVASALGNEEDFRKNMKILARCLNRLDIPLLLTMDYGKGDIIKEVSENCARTEKVERMQTDVWAAEDMGRYTSLIAAGKVIIAGAKTHIALLQAAEGFVERGYDVSIAEDCCASDNEREHKRAVKELRDMGCHITSLETAVMKLVGKKDSYIRSAIEEILEERKEVM